MKGAQALLRTLVDSGVDMCFANPGTSEMHFVAALDDVPRMRAVLGLFEGVVTGAADGYARMAGRPAVTLVHVVRAHRPEVAAVGGSRSGLVHRLDRDTSGAIAFAKTEAARDLLRAQWKARETLKVYHAIAEGFVEPAAGRIDAPIGPDPVDPMRRAVAERGDPAFSEYRVLEQYGDEAALVEVRILTGRTHQIRVHLEAIGHPIIGDSLYGPASARIARQALHAYRLGLCLPSTGEWREFVAPLPGDIEEAIDALRADHDVTAREGDAA